LLALLLLAEPAQAAPSGLLDGVRRVALPGVPGLLTVFGPKAAPVIAAPLPGGGVAPILAVARAGHGRLALFSHSGYFGAGALEQADTARLVENLLRWLAPGKRKPVVAVQGFPGFVRFLRRRGYAVRDSPVLHGIDVACFASRAVDPERMRAFLEHGGGFLSGLPGWGWQQLNPGQELATGNPLNRLAAPFGIVLGEGLVRAPASKRLHVVSAPPLTHAGRALDAIRARSTGKADRALALATLVRALRDLPSGDKLILPRLHRVARSRGAGRLALAAETIEALRAPPEKIRASPAADSFPGSVPRDAPRVTRKVSIDLSARAWRSTGLYAPPGGLIRIRLAPPDVSLGLRVRIGCHADRLWAKPRWKRAPEISRSFPLDAPESLAANAFGGLIYIEVPGKKAAGRTEVEIAGGVEAPRFVLGRTDPDAWRKRIRHLPAPWAEIGSRKVILTLPSEVVRSLDDPASLMRFWDRVLDADADLAARPEARARPERFVADVQIAAGYMHAGYPIMTHLDAAPRFVDLETLSTKGDWGMFHELGHNHQSPDWTFSGTTEVTCNLFTLYVLDTVCPRAEPHQALSRKARARAMREYKKKGAPFSVWRRKPFLALIPYVQLEEAFGWKAYRKVFTTYRALPPKERPRTDAAKRDQWMVRFSRAVGRDLGPFFTWWGIPTSEAARRSIADLPPWMPAR